MGNVRHQKKASVADSVWKTRGTVTAPEEKADSSEWREGCGDVGGLEPEVVVSAMECPDQD